MRPEKSENIQKKSENIQTDISLVYNKMTAVKHLYIYIHI